MSVRDAKLRGIRGANEALRKLKIRELIKNGGVQVDVFKCIHEMEIPIICRPLEGLLGAYIVGKDAKGIMVTSQRRLSIQRFTAAHELGHYWLQHSGSLDSEKDIRLARKGASQIALQEIEAEAFASEFLLPKFVLVNLLKRMGWTKQDVVYPAIMYQMSIRLGTSYEATWRALLENNIITQPTAQNAESTTPKELKRDLLNEVQLSNSWADVFHINEQDLGSVLQVAPDDILVLELNETPASGYIWDDVSIKSNCITKLADSRYAINSRTVGGHMKRRQVFRCEGSAQIEIVSRRPWIEKQDNSMGFNFKVSSGGSETGLPRVARKWEI